MAGGVGFAICAPLRGLRLECDELRPWRVEARVADGMQSRRQRLHCKLWLVAQIPDAVAVAEQQIEAGVARCDGWQRFAVCACAERARSEEHTSELQSLMRTPYAVFRLKKKNKR